MATTEDGLWTPDQVQDYNLVSDLATLAATIQEALNKRANSFRGTSTQRVNFTDEAGEGTIWTDTNGDKEVWVKQGNAWERAWTPGGGGVDFLGKADLGGSNFGSIEIPASRRGQYRKYTFSLSASAETVDSAGLRPVSLRPNGDGGENYRSTASVFQGTSLVAGTSSNNSAYPRTIYVGEFESNLEISFVPRDLGDTNFGSWTSSGFINSGVSTFYSLSAAGRWSGDSVQPLTHFEFRTNSSTSAFKSGSIVRMWGHI